MINNEYPNAIYKDGILYDDSAVEVAKLIGKENCKSTFDMNKDRIDHFVKRIENREDTSSDSTIIVIINVDDPYGGPLADILMPNHNWQEYRDRGEIPYARGLVEKEGIQNAVASLDEKAANKIKDINGTVVVVFDHQVVEVFEVT